MTDAWSPLTVKIMSANPDAYEALVVEGGTPTETTTLLGKVEPRELLLSPPKSQPYADAMLAGLWLWHDGLEECHHIVQNSPEEGKEGDAGRTYSFWHAIMHRREGDFSNSKYWYARAAGHSIIQTLTGHAGPLINRAPADKSLLRFVASGWNPNVLVDFVESIYLDEDDPRYPIAIQLQQLEWRVLWEYCVRLA